MFADRRILYILVLILLIIILGWAVDHLFFPDLPVPAGVPSISK